MIGETIATAIANLTARMPSPTVTRDKSPPRSIPADKAGGLGYNRDLIGAAQAFYFGSIRRWHVDPNC
jgi:hypothetical protein